MTGDPNHIEEAVRETLAGLSDRDLILRTQSREYTEFAREAAREELARRTRVQPSQPVQVPDSSVEESLRPASQAEGAGCYIDLWKDKDYEGKHVHITGPRQYSDLQSFPSEWGNNVSSLRVGPCAFVEAYDQKGLTGKMVCFGPNQDVPDLAEIEFENKIGSMKIISVIKIFDGLGAVDKLDTDVSKQPAQRN